MAISITCSKCKKAYRAKDELAGRVVTCPACSAAIQVPAAKSNASLPAAKAIKTPSAAPSSKATPATVDKHARLSAAAVSRQMPRAVTSPAPEAVRRAKPELTRGDVLKQVMAGFHGELPPRRASPMYLVGVFFTTAVMIALPLLYIALIGLVCWVVYLHMMNDTGMITVVHNARVAIFLLVAYVAPLIVGVILIAFMIKPLFAPPAREGRRCSFTRSAEPVLFAVVDKVCAVVGAPAPKRIDVNCDVNASASFRRGWLSAIIGSDLVLTVGIPLAAGLSLEQFVGVLAHEFGHFSQGVGMRLTYVVRSINHWFVRVVYQRDSWDVWLANSTDDLDFRIAWVLFVAQFCVWLTRKVLWALMMLGHLVAGFMLRQMEFDADSYQTRMVGSDTLAATFRKLPLLSMAYGAANSDAAEYYRDGKLPDNLPAMMLTKIGQMPVEVQEVVAKANESPKTGLFDTHPADKERIAASRRSAAAGVFHSTLPTSVLFKDFAATARSATFDFYCEVIGKHLKPSDLHSAETIAAQREKKPEVEETIPLE